MTNKLKQEDRHQAIKNLIAQEPISDQMKLVSLLHENYHIETNQAVVSRDLRRLGVIKKSVNNEMIYEIPSTDTATEILKLAVLDIQYNEVLIVIKTFPGLADFVGDCIDQYSDLDILGCLAGENVVFVPPRSTKKIEKTYVDLCKKIHFKKHKASNE